jgi:hypothetical protein
MNELSWQEEDAPSPYEAFAVIGITPASSMKQILDAMGELIEQGLWTPEKRAAWDALRTVERRLWVDLLSYPATPEVLRMALENLCAAEEPAMPLPAQPTHPQFEFRGEQSLADFDEPPEIVLRRLEFDS